MLPSRLAKLSKSLLNTTKRPHVLAPVAVTLQPIGIALFFSFYPTHIGDEKNWQCMGNGKIAWPDEYVDPGLWNQASWPDINVTFGDLTFAQSKGIDVAWDMAVGRGGQALLALCSYPVFRHALRRMVDVRGTSVRLYTATAFDQVSLLGLGTLIADGQEALKDKRDHEKACSRLRRMWNWRALLFVLAVIYVLLFPTWLLLMTGYSSTFRSVYQTPDDRMILLSSAERFNACVERGSQYGLPGKYCFMKKDEQPLYDILKDYECA